MFFSNRKMQAHGTSGQDEGGFAINSAAEGCPRLSDAARGLISASVSENTLRAYRSDLQLMTNWGGPLPWEATLVCEYLAAHAEALAIATLDRRLASLGKAHRSFGLLDPTKSEVVHATVRGIRRTFGKPQKQAKPLLKDDLAAICQRLGNSARDVRDRAILLLGFAGAFRRSEVVGLDIHNLEEVRQGLIVTLTASKTDQSGEGRQVAIPYGRTALCPVSAIIAWRELADLSTGPLFRPVDRHSNISPRRLSAEAICTIVRERCDAAGYVSGEFSGHSLRAGLATSAAIAGVASHKIRQQTGHASDAMLQRYIRISDMWTGNAAGSVL